ncbi:MAG: prepilin-type N-terminal cleavage/methylation domain-containing protein [Polyangiales bacterium]
MPKQRAHRRTRRRGFTILEVMVALAVGGIAITSLYAVGAASTQHFREQQRISAAQTSLRAAMDQLKHDFQRAGFLSTRNANLAGETCARPTFFDPAGQLAGVAGYVQRATAPTKLDPAGLNVGDTNAVPFYAVDQVWLTGNYATSGEYPGISLDAAGTTVTVPMNWQSFQRDFVGWSGTNTGCDLNAFNAAFPVGRMVRLHGLSGTKFFSTVSRVNCTGTTAATITLNDVVPTVCNMNGGWIAPVNTLRYSVVDATAAEDSTDARMTVLRRTEVQTGARTQTLMLTGGMTQVPVEDRAFLDYVVRFSVGFQLTRVDTPRMNFTPDTAANVLANPERIRGVILDVAVRTAQQEPSFLSNVPTSAFRVYTSPGAARVRRAHAELMLPNIAQ